MKLIITSIILFLAIFHSNAQDIDSSLIATTIMIEDKYIFVNAVPLSDYDTVGFVKTKHPTIIHRHYSHGGMIVIQSETVHRKTVKSLIKKGNEKALGYNGIIVSDGYQEGVLIKVEEKDEEKAKQAVVKKWNGIPVYVNAYPIKKFRRLAVRNRLFPNLYYQSFDKYMNKNLKKFHKIPHIDKNTKEPVTINGLVLDINYSVCDYFVFKKDN